MIFLGVDYGDKRTGLALCDETAFLAYPYKTVTAERMRNAIDLVAAAAKESGADKIVVGLPLNMDGTEGVRASKTRSFASVLGQVSGLEIILADERLSSLEADELLSQAKVKKNKIKDLRDQTAAVVILQSYLDAIKKEIRQ